MKKIPLKNYIIFIIICILTIGILIMFVNKYNSKLEYENSTNERMNFIREITYMDYSNYILENQEYIMYISNSENDNIDFETNLRKKIEEKDYIKNMVYFNSKENEIDLLETINKEYNINLNKLPNIIIVNEAKLVYYGYIDLITVDEISEKIEEYYD